METLEIVLLGMGLFIGGGIFFVAGAIYDLSNSVRQLDLQDNGNLGEKINKSTIQVIRWLAMKEIPR